MARFYEKIIGCRNEGIYRVVTLFGIKLRYRNARVQILAEIKKLSVQYTNLAVSIKTLSGFSKRSHETINALLTRRQDELNFQWVSLNEISREGHQEMTQKLGDANNLLKSHTAMLMGLRTMHEEVNELRGQNHQETAQKLDAANNLLKSHAEKLGELSAMQTEVSKLQEQNHQKIAQKLDAANNLLKSHVEKLEELDTVQTGVSELQGQNHQETIQKLDEINKLVRTDVGRVGSLLELEYSSIRYYQNPFEKGFLIPMFAYMDRPDFEEKYLALIRGMAPPSIQEINKILCRVNMVKAKPDQTRYNFYSIGEQDERTKHRTDFSNRILRISDNLYAYDKYLLPINHFEKCVFLYKHGIELVRDKESIKEKDMIDAGGFIGDSALVLSDYTDKRIFSFEANPQNFDLLKKTLEINHLSKVVPVQKALWNSETELEMHVQGSCSSFTEVGGIQYVNGTVKVPTVTLDHFVRRRRLKVGLIKVDLEGAELEFLQGAEHTIRTQKPVLLLSIYHKPSDFFELKPMLEQWVPEYEFTVFNPVDWGILLETMIVAQPRLSLSQKS